jgi:hypothetical protein
MKGDIKYLIGKDVQVAAHGIIYRGRLIEVGMEEVYLKGDTGWITIMTTDVDSIREAKAPKRDKSSTD